MAGGLFGALGGMGADPSGVDANWYLQTYPDVAQAIQAGMVRSPAEHFAMFGQKEGRFPNAQAAGVAQGGPAQAPSGNQMPTLPGGPQGKGDLPNGQPAPAWVTAARQANAGMNNMPFVLNPQSLSGSDQRANGAYMYPGAARFASPAPPAPAPTQALLGGQPPAPMSNPLLGSSNPVDAATRAAFDEQLRNQLLNMQGGN
jgi:hypothetical protein